MDVCRQCRRPVLWARTSVNNKPFPLDPVPDEAKNQAAYRNGLGAWLTRQLKDGAEPDGWERRYMPHVATCPGRPAPSPAPLRPVPDVLPRNVIPISRARSAQRGPFRPPAPRRDNRQEGTRRMSGRFRRAAVLAGVIIATALITACHGSGGASSAVSAAATSTQVQQDKQAAASYVKACIPATGPGQVKLAHSLLTGSKTSKQTARQHLAACLGVPPARRQAWEGALVTAAEHVNWSSKTSRDKFVNVTAVQITEQYRAGAAPAPAPSVTK